ncbi:MAG: hypothetical protein UV66_C0011G0002 [Candidatus Woesebacteria bacterium GW2011_GWA1_43_12]|uniref:Uncharacterized protein n=1 Tax=Candidatus Woesebacteria bacterium GW2011_GWA1_43_12 TaxID=1618557 RepID=A0A0G1CWM8_9BACT|nr:MAG: hypothetical protein UV66_C0011G0002 [Candidatus Woesebacteria bacterium GW2011_GWA1_43_12]
MGNKYRFKPEVIWRGDNNCFSTRLENPLKFFEGQRWVGQMLKHMLAENKINGIIF